MPTYSLNVLRTVVDAKLVAYPINYAVANVKAIHLSIIALEDYDVLAYAYRDCAALKEVRENVVLKRH